MLTGKNVIRAVATLVSMLLMFSGFSVADICAANTENDFEYYSYGDYIEIRGYIGAQSEIEVPSTIDELPVKSIGSYAFRDEADLKKIFLPSSIAEIKNGAFSGCINLEEVNIPQDVTYINSFTFCDCKKLKNVDLDDRILGIGKYAFAGCEALESIYLPEKITCIADWTFFHCKNLQEVNIPQGVKSIGNTAFSSCESLKEIEIPNGVESIGNSAFSLCKNLESVIIKEGMKSIGENAFWWCDSLRTIALPATLTDVWDDAFLSLGNLKHVLYAGSQTQWKQIEFNTGNDSLHTAVRHYDVSENPIKLEVTEPSCNKHGYTRHYCTMCDFSYITDEADFTEHIFIDGVCTVCSSLKLDLIESEHSYPNNFDFTYVINKPKAESVTVTFSAQTQTEQYYDYIYIYDGKGVLLGSYTGDELAAKSVTVKGDTIKIRLVTDAANTAYGFLIVYVEAIYPEEKHFMGDVNLDGDINIKDATSIQKHLVSLIMLSEDALALGDFDLNGSINIKDATAIQKFIAGIII